MSDDGPTPRRGLGRVRPTARGTAVLAGGLTLVGAGSALGLAEVVGLGAAGLLVVAGAWAWMLARRIDRGRGALDVTRRIEPSPAVRGRQVTTRLLVSPVTPTATALGRLGRLQISEQAASELCENDALRAQVVTHQDRIAVRYQLRPEHRGRWPLGPVLASRVDLFGLVRAVQPLGEPVAVAVLPRTTELSARVARAFGDIARSAHGARTSSSDDSVLREYVAGDDPRRVHWATAARRGQLMVRTDENAGIPPVTLLFDRGTLPPPGANRATRSSQDGEWAVEAAASVAVALLGAGHPVRLVPSSTEPAIDSIPFSTGRSTSGTAPVLEGTIDLEGHAAPHEADHALAVTADSLRASRRPGELTVAVLSPLAPLALSSVAPMAGDGHHWAIVVAPPDPGQAPLVSDTLSTLRSLGWQVVAADPRASTIDHAWTRLMDEHR
ncbi:DUF58 domain-containing protein [Oerskovia turbata]